MLNMFCQISYAIHIFVPFVQSSYKLNWKNKILICQVQVANKDFFFASLTWRQICSGKQSLRHGWNVSRLSSTLLLSFFLSFFIDVLFSLSFISLLRELTVRYFLSRSSLGLGIEGRREKKSELPDWPFHFFRASKSVDQLFELHKIR